eukprot:27597-Eustigmatos_ZCMA.PRE.1
MILDSHSVRLLDLPNVHRQPGKRILQVAAALTTVGRKYNIYVVCELRSAVWYTERVIPSRPTIRNYVE